MGVRKESGFTVIQDIAPHKLKNQYRPERKALSEDKVFVFKEGALLLGTEGNEAVLPVCSDFDGEDEFIYLIELDGQAYFHLVEPKKLPQGFEFKTLKEIRSSKMYAKEFVFLSITAFQLANWYKDNRYCGRCGERTGMSETERAIQCPSCGRLIYPRIVPAVIVGVINDDKILVTKYAGRDIPYFALIAGFTEIGETLEETVEREVMEEAGLKVKNITYYKSQPWGIVDDILAGFFCEVDGDTTIHADKNELKLAEWRTREEVVLQPDDYSLTNEMMMVFKNGEASSDLVR